VKPILPHDLTVGLGWSFYPKVFLGWNQAGIVEIKTPCANGAGLLNGSVASTTSFADKLCASAFSAT
jgi:hypothetical protein